MKKLFFYFLLAFPSLAVFGQYSESSNWYLGIKGGSTYSGISNISGMFYPDNYFDPSTYRTASKDTWAWEFGVFAHYNAFEYLKIQPEIFYNRQGSRFFYDDNMNTRYSHCRIDLVYDYIGLNMLFKLQWADVLKGLTVQFGPKFAFCINQNAIRYTSENSLYSGDDDVLTQSYKNAIKGRFDCSLGAGLGYEFPIPMVTTNDLGIGISAMYYWGMSDVLETTYNNYNFIDNKNKSHSLVLSISFAFSLEDH